MHHHSLLPPTLCFLLFLLYAAAAAAAASHRRLLHQPLFPLTQSQPPTTTSISNPPYPSPSPQSLPQPNTTPKYPFSTLPPPDNTPQNPFFPFFPSPPPPPPPPASSSSAAFPTFPANISSLVIPASSHTSHAPIKLITLIVSISLFSTLIFASVLLLLRRHHHHHHHHHHPLKSDSLRLFPPDTAPSDTSTAAVTVDPSKKPPTPLFPRHTSTSTSSSEFLYLGTLVSSRDAEYSGPVAPPAAAAQLDAKSSPIPPAAASVNYQRHGSPELQPLPPLPRQQSNQSYHNATHVTSSEGDNDREDDDEFFSPRGSTGNNASPYRTRLSPKPKPLNSLTANSPTYSISLDNSPSVVLNSGSPQSMLSKSPDSSVTFPAPITRFIPPPPAREPRTFSPFSPSSTDDCGTRDCSPRPSDFSAAGAVPVPPPPPPPPARFWDGVPTSGPPELVAPSRKASKSEEMVKPKLKALHWDKVRASSDRAMVWDQLKSSSFQ